MVEYYISNNSLVYLLLINDSKAFDRLSHRILFKIWLERGSVNSFYNEIEMEQFLFRFVSIVELHKTSSSDLSYTIYHLYRLIFFFFGLSIKKSCDLKSLKTLENIYFSEVLLHIQWKYINHIS